MDEENLSNDNSSSSTKSCKEFECGTKCRQIFITLAICYICISGGNLVGYTSSAIPSIRKGTSATYLRILEQSPEIQYHHPRSNDTISVQEIDTVLESIRSEKVEATTVLREFAELTDSQASWIGGLAPLGAFFGSFVAPFPIKMLGPKGTILKVAAPVYAFSWFATSLAPTVMYIYLSRLLGGLAMGMSFSAVPIYIVETASLELRGPLGTLSQFLFTVGVLMSFIIGYFFDWRTLSLISGFTVLPTFIMLPLIPESPVWLPSKTGKSGAGDIAFWRKQRFSMQSIEFRQLQSQPRSLDVNCNSHKYSVRDQQQASKSIFNSPKMIGSTAVVMFLSVFQQLTGINAINFYTVTIFEIAAGQNSALDGHSSSSAIIVALVFCLANICSYTLIERLGRKLLLIVSTIFISLSSFSLGTYFYFLKNGYDTSSLGFIPLASLITFVLAFSTGYGPLLYVIISEVLPNRVRAVVTPWAVGVNWLCVFFVAKTFPGVIHALEAYGAFWIFGSFSCVSLIFTIFYVPETKGKTEAEIQSFFDNCSVGAMVSTVPCVIDRGL